MLANPYLRLIAALVVLLNVVNTTGEYLVARLLTNTSTSWRRSTRRSTSRRTSARSAATTSSGSTSLAFLLQAFVTSRLVKYRGLRGALLALPLIALGGYAIIAAGVGFSVVRWIKTAENATDYSIMNTARQLLWLPTTREEKYKAKQAIDTFFVRGGDVLSAVVVYVGHAHAAPDRRAVRRRQHRADAGLDRRGAGDSRAAQTFVAVRASGRSRPPRWFSA